ncbi:putative bifunctional diguanylate cyclase/phosphodiesterase [Rhizobium sp.]
MDSLGTADDNDHFRRLRAAQAENLLANTPITLLANVFIAATTAWLLWKLGISSTVFLWLAAVGIVGVLRFAVYAVIQRSRMHVEKPVRALHLLTLLSFASGLSWTPLPLVFPMPGNGIVTGYTVFVMAGISMGAIIQSLAYWRVALAFGAPLMSATIAMLLLEGDTVSHFLALNITLLTVMLFRSSIRSEQSFVQSQNTAMRTSQLAHSLAAANGEISKTSQRLEHLANSDALTGLANRAVFNRRMEHLFERCRQRQTEIALLLIDLDKFKTINDTRGHSAGDMLLKQVANRLAAASGRNDLAVRLGGDEFAVVLWGADLESRVNAMVLDVMKRIAQPIAFGGQDIVPSASIGVAFAPRHATDGDDLYACADLALYRAKMEGRRQIRFFDAALKDRLDYERAIDRDLAAAIENGGLDVHFQPQVDMSSERATGFEALVRWWHPEIGAIAPPDIVKAAGKLQLSEQLTGYVADRTCAFARRLDAEGHGEVMVSINMSPSEFGAYDAARLLSGIASRHQVDPARIEVEITEDAILDPKKVERALAGLRHAGFGLAVDDFGMGHSSLAHLISLKIDRLKVDRHFVTGISGNAHNQALVGALVSVGRSLDMELVLEGVETAADAETLRAFGCRTGQGWLYGKAMAPDDAMQWLKRHSARIRAVA